MSTATESPRRGRPAHSNTHSGNMKRVYVTLDDYTTEFMRRLGAGNISAGIREAARVIYELKVEKDRLAQAIATPEK